METKPRPKTLSGHNYKLDLEHGHLFITINHLDDKPFEVFLWQGKGGSQTYGLAEALGRMVSLHLRRDTPVGEIIKQLDGIGEVQPWPNSWLGEGVMVKGIADGLAKCLQYFVDHHESEVESGAKALSIDIRDIATDTGVTEETLEALDKSAEDHEAGRVKPWPEVDLGFQSLASRGLLDNLPMQMESPVEEEPCPYWSMDSYGNTDCSEHITCNGTLVVYDPKILLSSPAPPPELPTRQVQQEFELDLPVWEDPPVNEEPPVEKE